MIDKQTILDALIAFGKRSKFSISIWQERGLIPPNHEISDRLEIVFNDCVEHLIEATNSGLGQRELKNILKKWLKCLVRFDYDTEERELIAEYFDQLSKIVSVDFKDNLNTWLYGKMFNTLFKVTSFLKGREYIVETLCQTCVKCNSKLETFVMRKEEGIPDFSWKLIQCNNCDEYNLLSTGPNIKESRFGNYKLIEQLSKTEFTEEEANTRLRQIKFFRK